MKFHGSYVKKVCKQAEINFQWVLSWLCVNREKGYVTTLSSENNLMFRLNAPVVIRAKVKELRTLLFIAMHY